MTREKLLQHIAALVGSDIMQIIDAQQGWPGLARIRVGDLWLPAAIHCGPLGTSHRNRDDVERRFQNPGQDKPVVAPPGYLPLLIGIWEETDTPVLVGMDAESRVGKMTRQSLFISLWALEAAAKDGWSEHVNTNGERIFAFHPALLPTYAVMRSSGTLIPAEETLLAIEATGMLDPEPEAAVERARRVTSQLVRSSSFRQKVVRSYDGRCAMCGFNFSMVEGAHIYPATAPGSHDEVWNGMALCGNHHTAFDRHRIWVDPDTRGIQLHQDILDKASLGDACGAFVSTTFSTLAVPADTALAPRAEMFVKRYELYDSKYDWVKR